MLVAYKTLHNKQFNISIIAMALMLSACSSYHRVSTVPQQKPVAAQSSDLSLAKQSGSKKSKRYHTVKNKRYSIGSAKVGERMRGDASWYGRRFHGRLTANREVFNMYKLTAAHKSLPLPSYVKVTNLLNQKSITVRVNDRGPFYGDRIIDLSYQAARAIDMVSAGVVPVEVEVLELPAPKLKYIQVASYKSKKYANRLVRSLRQKNLKAFALEPRRAKSTIHRVRVGPLRNSYELETTKAVLDRSGYRNYIFVN